MFKLLRYLSRYRTVFLAGILLAAGQSFFELLMPAIMGNIVNVGIQQHGIEVPAPTVLTREDAALLEHLLPGEELGLFEAAYDSRGDTALLHRSADLSSFQLEQLGDDIGVAGWTLIYLARGRNPEAAPVDQISDLSELDVEEMLQAAPSAVSQAVLLEAQQKARAVPADLRRQTACALTAYFYKEAGVSPEVFQLPYIASMCGRLALAAAASYVCAALMSLCASRAAAGLAKNLRCAVYSAVMHARPATLSEFEKGSLLARTTSDVTLVQSSVYSITRIVVFALCMGIGGIAGALMQDVRLGWIVGLGVLAAAGVVLLIFCITRPRYRIVQRMIDRLNRIVEEDLHGAAVIRASNLGKREEQRFDASNDMLATTQLGINRILSFLSPSFVIIANVVSLVVVWAGAYAAQGGLLEIGSLLAFVQYAAVVFASFTLIAGMFVIVPRVSVAASRILEVLTSEPQSPETAKQQTSDPSAPLKAEDVSFAYPGADSFRLKNISFEAAPGEVLAVAGPSASGKSTLLRLLAGMHQPDQGRIQAGGTGGSAPLLLHGTSPAYAAPGISAGTHSRFPDTEGVSALLIDDLHQIQDPDGVLSLGAQRPVVFTTNSAAYCQYADRVLFLADGRVAGAGTPKQLLRTCPSYRDFAGQAGEEEPRV